jgi:hypothetical protein
VTVVPVEVVQEKVAPTDLVLVEAQPLGKVLPEVLDIPVEVVAEAVQLKLEMLMAHRWVVMESPH